MIQSIENPPQPSCHRSPARKAAGLITALLLLVSALASAQEGTEQPGGQGEQNPAEFSDLGLRAYEKWQQDDFPGAIALLEEQRRTGTPTHVDLALLGALYLESGRAREALDAFKVVADAAAADPAVLFNAGRAALSLGEVEVAEGYLERSVAKVPVSPAARQLGILRGAQGRVTEAYRLLRGWVAQNLGDTEARVALIAAGLRIGRAAEVGPLLQGLPEGDPRVVLLRAQVASETGDQEGAVALLEPLRDTAPPPMQADVYRLLADNYIDVGRSSDAVALLEGRIGRDPRLAVLLAEGQHRTGDYAAAVATLEPFAKPVLEREGPIEPLAAQVASDFGRNLTAADRAEDALPYLRKATAARPREQLAWKSLGDALMALGRRDEAAAALDRFRELSEAGGEAGRESGSPTRDPASKAILEAQQAMAKGEHQRALAVLRQEVALAPRDVRPRLVESQLLLMLQRYQEALGSADATLELFPDSADALYQRGVIHMALDNPAAAAQDLRRVLELVPEHVAAMNDLAVVLTIQGKKDEARVLLERLLQLSPDNRLALDNLERLRKGGGD